MSAFVERKAGTTTVNETVERDWLNFATIPELQQAWIQRLADAMLKRVTALKDATEADALGVTENPEFRRLYISGFEKLSRGMGQLGVKQTLTDEQAAIAWKKITEPALKLYREMKFRASAPPLPKTPPAEGAIEVEPIPEEEPATTEPSPEMKLQQEQIREALSKFCAEPRWYDAKMDRETLGSFNGGFVPILGDLLRVTPAAEREQVIQRAHDLYDNVMRGMYYRTYADDPVEIRKAQFDAWIERAWPNLVTSAKAYIS